MKVLIFDISNLMMRCLYAQMPSPTEKKFSIFKQTFLTSFMKTIKDNNPEKVIAVLDSESWRKEIYSDYKANRAAKREQSPVDFDVFFPVATKFFDDLASAFKNIQFIKLPRCEADDIIAVITKNKPEWDIINVSSDKDFHQLFQYPNYKQYNGLDHTFIECLNPKEELLIKIIRGDSVDNVPSIKKGLRTKKILAAINENLDQWLIDENLKEKFDLNMQLISFSCIPKELEIAIMEQVNNFVPGKYDGRRYFNIVQIEGLPELMPLVSEHSELIKHLK